MSLQILNQVYDEVRRLSIAGSSLAAGDFRLKKLVPPLEKSGEKAPVFAKVAQAANRVLESSNQDSAPALLDLSTLTTAILYTQGETGIEGPLEPIPSSDLGLMIANTSARVLKPLLEALTTTGSGRAEIIKDAHQRGAFKDLRLMKPAIAAIEDPYPEIGEFVADQILPMYGRPIFGEIKAKYDPKGKGDDARRLRVMHRLDPEATHELVEHALDEGSKDVKLEALKCLGGDRSALPYLMEQSKAKAKEVREAALRGLASFPDEEVVDVLAKVLAGPDVGMVAGAVRNNPSPRLKKIVLEEAVRQRDALFALKPKDKADPAAMTQRFNSLLEAFEGRTDKEAEAFLVDLIVRRDELLRHEKGIFDGAHIIGEVCEMLLKAKSKPGLKVVMDAAETLPPQHVGFSFLAASRLKKQKEVFDLFSLIYLSRPTGKKKNDQAAYQRSESLAEVLQRIRSGRHAWYANEETKALYEGIELDPRWLDAAVQADDLETMLELARPKHPALLKSLADKVDAELSKKKFDPDYQFDDILGALLDIGHPQAVDKVIASLEKPYNPNRSWYWIYSVSRIIPKLPAEAAPRIEALIPNMHERVVDAIVPFLDELKRKAPTV